MCHRCLLVLTALLALTTTSCIQYRDLIVLDRGEQFPEGAEKIDVDFQLRVQPDDILYISVHTLDETLSRPYNLLNTGNITNLIGNAAQNPLVGYLVDPNGYIDFPGLGPLKVGGLTIDQVKRLVIERLRPYLVDPVVRVRFLNFKISVLGEVRRPGIQNYVQQRVTILEALAQAGDVTELARRDNILVIRELDGRREYGRVNLHDRNLFDSPYFYLKQNDVIYVQPARAKLLTVADPVQKIGTWIGAVSSLISLALILTR